MKSVGGYCEMTVGHGDKLCSVQEIQMRWKEKMVYLKVQLGLNDGVSLPKQGNIGIGH
jgi:hypothetical protein